ncbi:MAG: tRNA dihydrouridine synthase DusB [Planctomycetota bacterium]
MANGPHTLTIGDVVLPTNLLLAPVAGYFDLAYRLVVRSVGGVACEADHQGDPAYDIGDGTYGSVGLTCTELLCPHAILKENDKTMWLAATSDADRPVGMQLYGADPGVLAEAARWAESQGATLIDINMGCPVDKVTKKNGGSKLLCDPSGAAAICRTVVDAVTVPVTCKIRLGWDDDSIIADTLPSRLCDVGAKAITVHGRTTAMRFRPSVRLEGIAMTVEGVKKHHPQVPVIGNGDVVTPEDAERMIRVTGCDGVMIARGAMGQPWLFRDTAYYLKTGRPAPPLTRYDRAKLVLDHFNNLVKFRNEHEALHQIRFRTAKYSQHLQPWPGLRRAVQPIKTARQFRDYWAEGLERIKAEDTVYAGSA